MCVVHDALAGAILGLRAVEAEGLDRFVAALPSAVAVEGRPAAEGPIRGGGGTEEADDGGAALPEDGVGRRPARAGGVEAAVREDDGVAVDAHVVEEQAGG